LKALLSTVDPQHKYVLIINFVLSPEVVVIDTEKERMETGGTSSKPSNDAIDSPPTELDSLETPGNESKDFEGDLKKSPVRVSDTACDSNKTGEDYEGYLAVAGADIFPPHLTEAILLGANQALDGKASAPSAAGTDPDETSKDYEGYLRMAGGNEFPCHQLQGQASPGSDAGTCSNKTGKDYEGYLTMAGGDQVANEEIENEPIGPTIYSMEDESIFSGLQRNPSQGTNRTPTSLPGAFAHGGQGSEPPVQRMAPNHQPVHPVSLPRLTILDGPRTSTPSAGCSLDVANLVEAQPVTDELDTLVRASPAEEKQPSARRARKNNCKMIFLLVVMVCIVASAVLIAWWSGAMDKQHTDDAQYNSTSVADQGKQPTTPEDYLKQYLPDETLRDLGNDTSPQYLAFQWLHQDPSLLNYTEARLRQRYALATFFHSTGGNNVWAQSNHWLDYQVHECEWYFAGSFKVFGLGQTARSPCSSRQRMDKENYTNYTDDESYKLLWLNRNNVTGPIPREVYWLTSLESIDLGVNQVHGSIDSGHIQALQNLRQLSFPANQLTGPIPKGLGFLSKLEILYFGKNFMTGTLPRELAFLRNTLKQLTVHSNNFHGSIPSEIGELSHLTVLGLNFLPFLTGTIPTEWGKLTSLEYIYAFGNPLVTGPIPSEVGLMINLAWLHLNSCQLTGSVPSTLGKLALTMKELELFDNRLTGSLATELGLLTNMYSFGVGVNDLTGPVPSEFGRLSSLQVFDLQMNNLTGTLPPELSALKMIEDFNMALNSLSGTIPEVYGSWPIISTFNVTGNNGLQGTIPEGLCLLRRNESNQGRPQTKELPISYVLTKSFLDFDCNKAMCGCDCQCFD
jgi:Leucine-rich repeat (LRR) protein